MLPLTRHAVQQLPTPEPDMSLICHSSSEGGKEEKTEPIDSVENSGEPCRIRTCDPLIKSPKVDWPEAFVFGASLFSGVDTFFQVFLFIKELWRVFVDTGRMFNIDIGVGQGVAYV